MIYEGILWKYEEALTYRGIMPTLFVGCVRPITISAINLLFEGNGMMFCRKRTWLGAYMWLEVCVSLLKILLIFVIHSRF